MNTRVGYRFHPTDEELVDYFLRRKLNGADFDDDDVRDIDICNFEPWDLPKYAARGSDDQVWYFFYRREKKYRSAGKPRYNRSTKTGHWKPTGAERSVRAKRTRKEIGVKRTLVFYKHGEPKELRTNWVIHEYEPKILPNQQAEWVLCKLKEKADAKADSSAYCIAESSHSGAPDFQTYPIEVPFPISQDDRQKILETVFPGRMDFEQPCELHPQIQIDEAFSALQQQIQLEDDFSYLEPQIELEEGVSIDDLMWDDDIFQNGSNGLTGDFTGGEQFMYAISPRDVEETASNAYTHWNRSSSQQSFGGVYLEELCDMDSHDVYTKSCQFGDSSLKKGEASSKEYRQMRSVQAITETLPLPICKQGRTEKIHVNRDEILVMEASSGVLDIGRHEKRNFIGKARKEFPSMQAGAHRGIHCSQSKARNQIQVKRLSGISKPKAKEAMCGTDVNLPHKSLEESIVVKTERDRKMVTAKTNLKPRTERVTGNNKNCSSIQLEMSILNQRSLPISVYIVNLFIGMVLFIAVGRDLLILH